MTGPRCSVTMHIGGSHPGDSAGDVGVPIPVNIADSSIVGAVGLSDVYEVDVYRRR